MMIRSKKLILFLLYTAAPIPYIVEFYQDDRHDKGKGGISHVDRTISYSEVPLTTVPGCMIDVKSVKKIWNILLF